MMMVLGDMVTLVPIHQSCGARLTLVTRHLLSAQGGREILTGYSRPALTSVIVPRPPRSRGTRCTAGTWRSF